MLIDVIDGIIFLDHKQNNFHIKLKMVLQSTGELSG